jgi:hypothetical protein
MKKSFLNQNVTLMDPETIEQKAFAINEAYHNFEVRKAFASIHNYPEDLLGKHRTEFYFWLMNTATRNAEEQAAIQKVINHLKAAQQREFAKVSQILNPLTKEDVHAFTEELKNLGGGNKELGEEYLKLYLED